jgi:hypothetical protein
MGTATQEINSSSSELSELTLDAKFGVRSGSGWKTASVHEVTFFSVEAHFTFAYVLQVQLSTDAQQVPVTPGFTWQGVFFGFDEDDDDEEDEDDE